MIDRFIGKLTEDSKISLFESIALCTAISLAGGFLFYDAYYSFMGFYRVVVTVLTFVMWASCALLNGKRKQWGFLVFSVLYWIIPWLFRLCVKPSAFKGTVRNAVIVVNKFFEMVFELPFEAVARSLGTEYWVFIILLAVVIAVSFYLGFRISADENRRTVREKASVSETDEREEEYDDDFEDLNSYLDDIDFDD